MQKSCKPNGFADDFLRLTLDLGTGTPTPTVHRLKAKINLKKIQTWFC